jgi:hypothetical protein
MTAPWVQTLLAATILAGAAVYLARRAWRRIVLARTPQPGRCGSDCGCGH